MTFHRSAAAFISATFVWTVGLAPAGAQDRPPRVVEAGPQGPLDELGQANEVRVTFSEPMVSLGRIPDPARAPFFRIAPDVAGSFRWAGTRTLIFMPAAPLPYATRYTVRIDTSATSARGAKLAAPYEFAFVTPVVRLRTAEWYRREGRFDRPVVLVLRFDQPVSGPSLLPHLGVRHEPHAFSPPALSAASRRRMAAAAPGSLEAFQERVLAAARTAKSREPVTVRLARDWDRQTYPAAPEMVVLETEGVPGPDAWLRVTLGPGARGLGGPETPGRAQSETVHLEPTLFVEGFRCEAACEPDGYNPLRLRGRVGIAQARAAVSATDVTDPSRELPLTRGRGAPPEDDEGGGYEYDQSAHLTLEDLGFSPRPARTYAVRVGPDLAARDGQTLGYTWIGLLENWHQRAFTSFGSGHAVWEAEGGAQLPFYARNLASVTQWLAPLRVDELVPAILRLRASSFEGSPAGPGHLRALQPKADVLQSYALDLGPVLSPVGTGLGWAALRDGEAIPRAHHDRTPRPRSAVVQATRLGITVKDSPSGSLVLVTRLADASPVGGATVRIRSHDNAELWVGQTAADGVAHVPPLPLRDPERDWEFRFVVIAEKDGDVAYVGSDWNEGLEPWAFGLRLDLAEARPVLRGAAFPDRGVYRLGEEARVKLILRSDTAEGMRLLPAGTAVDVVLRDSQGADVEKATLALSDWSSAEWAVRVREDGPLGTYDVVATVAGQRESVTGTLLVAAYRRPDFRVDVELAGDTPVAGATLAGVVSGRYLFGGTMSGRPVRWTFSRRPETGAPAGVTARFPADKWVLVDEERDDLWSLAREEVLAREGALDAQGQLALDLETSRDAGRPFSYLLEAEVTDVSRQAMANRASFRVEPAPWYAALKRPPYFATAQSGTDTEIAALGLDGAPVAGVPVTVVLTRVQWHAVRRAEGQGFYTWETERRETEEDRWELTTTASPQPLHVDLPGGGYYVLRATVRDDEGRSNTSATGFYALGEGYTAWARQDHNRIELVPERARYAPGETARLLVKSPWEQATALLTVEREGIRSHRVFTLRSTQETVEVPITEAEVPNVYVSVVLLKGRTGGYTPEDTSDPGKPSHRVGYAKIEVEDARKVLRVEVRADREEYRPGTKAKVSVTVRDSEGRPAPSEVTLWAVDHGVLSLTGYGVPDVRRAVWVEKALQVLTADSRQNIVSRRVIVGKGDAEGGGGGGQDGPDARTRRDFRVLAFYLGALHTDSEGRIRTEVTLPEDLTTYRVMAVAADRQSRFGGAEREIRTNKPVLLRPAFPRFLARGDVARFGAVLHSLLKDEGTALVTLRSLDPALVEVAGPARQSVKVAPQGGAEVRFELRAKAVGRARLEMTARLRGETDAFVLPVPVQALATPEVVAAYGIARPDAREALELPSGVVPDLGGLRVELASTVLAGLGEGAGYLVDYPYGCAEQRASAALALMLATDLGEAFRIPGLETSDTRNAAADALRELEAFQCPDGAFGFWKGRCDMSSPYLTAWVLHVLQRGRSLGHAVPEGVLERGRAALEKALGETGAGGPVDFAAHAFAVKVLAQGGRPQDSHVNRLLGQLDRAPVFAMAYLLDALGAAKDTGPRRDELRRRIRNAIPPEGGAAQVEELADPRLLWIWSSNVRSTAIALGALVRDGEDEEQASRLVRGLMSARRQGRWGNTQENAAALDALVAYYRRYETGAPDFRGTATLAGRELLAGEFRGRDTAARSADLSLVRLLPLLGAGEADLVFRREGEGTLHYLARLSYARDGRDLPASDQGFGVERAFAPEADGAAPGLSFAAGDLVRVTLRVRVPKERRFVALTDPLPAGLEPVESWFASTASDLAGEAGRSLEGGNWWTWWERGGFDRVERHDDRVVLFATRLGEGEHVFSYLARATTAGTFSAAPARAEEMYAPEVSGRAAAAVVTVR